MTKVPTTQSNTCTTKPFLQSHFWNQTSLPTPLVNLLIESVIENAQRHFDGSLFGCFEYVPYTALTIFCTINVSIDYKKNKVSNPFTRKNILDYKSRQ